MDYGAINRMIYIFHKRYVILIASILVLLILLACMISKQETIVENLWVLGTQVSGMPKDKAVATVLAKIERIEEGPFIFRANDVEIEVSSSEIEIILDKSSLIEQLNQYTGMRPRLDFQRYDDLPEIILEAAGRVVSPHADIILNNIASQLSYPASYSRFEFREKEFLFFPAATGQLVAPLDILEAISSMTSSVIEIEAKELPAPQDGFPGEMVMVAEYATFYDETEEDRVTNLELAAQAVHGRVVFPGDVYSFNKEAGERTERKGYKYANVVVGDRLVPGLAGGICQVTTTLFNAAAMAGLEFPEVHAHGIPVEYVPPGRDAAVAWSYMDLKIRNSLAVPVIFGAWVEEGQVLVRVYGAGLDKQYDLEAVVLAEYPAEGKNPGLLVETYQVEIGDNEVVRKALLMRSLYQPTLKNDHKEQLGG